MINKCAKCRMYRLTFCGQIGSHYSAIPKRLALIWKGRQPLRSYSDRVYPGSTKIGMHYGSLLCSQCYPQNTNIYVARSVTP